MVDRVDTHVETRAAKGTSLPCAFCAVGNSRTERTIIAVVEIDDRRVNTIKGVEQTCALRPLVISFLTDSIPGYRIECVDDIFDIDQPTKFMEGSEE